MNKLSVIIPTKNPGELFKKVISSLLDQKTDWPYEILIIDSGSSDGTVDYCKSVEKVKLHEIPSSEFGHGKTRNLGAELTDGEFICFLTHDAMPANENCLTNLVKVMDDPDVAGAFGRHLPYPECDIFTARDLQLHFDGFKDQPVVFMEDKERYVSDVGYKQYLHFFSDNCSILRRSIWEKIPYQDVNFAEDQIWAREIIEAGYKKAFANDALVYHSHSYSGIELLRRSFDEARCFRRYFGYFLSPSLLHCIGGAWRQARHDRIYFKGQKHVKNSYQKYGLLETYYRSYCRSIGHFLGTRINRIPLSVQKRISLDSQLQRQ